MLDHMDSINTADAQSIFLPKLLLTIMRELSSSLYLEVMHELFMLVLKVVGKIHPENSTLNEESLSLNTPEDIITCLDLYTVFYEKVLYLTNLMCSLFEKSWCLFGEVSIWHLIDHAIYNQVHQWLYLILLATF